MYKKKTIAIVGAGASGMMAALQAKKAGARPVIFELGRRACKKLSMTGNGRCNFTHQTIPDDAYHGKSFVRKGLSLFGPSETIEFFRHLGIEPKFRGDYVYPHSDQALSVADALLFAVRKQEIPLFTETRVTSLQKKDRGFLLGLGGKDNPFRGRLFDGVILSSGSKAFVSGDADGDGYLLARSLGHRILPPLPALCALFCNERSFFEAAQGVRTDAEISLFSGEKRIASESGELQLTKNGLSGIPVFQISRHASPFLSRGRSIKAVVDFLPNMEDAFSYLIQRRKYFCPETAAEFGNGLLAGKLWRALLRRAGIGLDVSPQGLTEGSLFLLAKLLKESSFIVERTSGFENAQVCRGGVDTAQVEASTMESKLVKGLYITGELLDVDGICGGFNLQWAWTSGYLAGRSCAGASEEKQDDTN